MGVDPQQQYELIERLKKATEIHMATESDLKRAIADARAASVSDRMIGEAMTAGCADPEEIFEMLQEPPGKSS